MSWMITYRVGIKFPFFLLFFLFLTPFTLAIIDIDTDGEIPEYFSRFFTNASTNSIVGDFSSVPRNFTVQPPQNEVWRISRIILTIKDANINNFNEYGGLTALTNGILLGVVRNNLTTELNPLRNTTDMFTIHTNGDWASLMFDLDIKDLGAGDDYVVGRWSFNKANTLIRLDGNKSDFAFIQVSDDLTGLSDHLFIVQGYKEIQNIDNTQEVNDRMLLAIISIVVLGFLFLLLAMWQKDTNLAFMSGFIFCIAAIYIFRNGLPSFSNWMVNSTSLILLGVGFYILFRATIEHLEESEQT